MFVGVLRLTLHLPDPGSLKSKRHLVRSAIDRVKARFNVSIAEVAENDLWQKSVIGVAAVGNDHAFVNETLDKVGGLRRVDARRADPGDRPRHRRSSRTATSSGRGRSGPSPRPRRRGTQRTRSTESSR